MWPFKSGKSWPQLDFATIKQRSRIVVIDDTDFPYVDLFKRDGYQIEFWSDIVSLPRLEEGHFDVILLDIQGVGREESQEQGLGILRHIKTVRPSQIVIAFSNADWSLKYQDFFELADARLAKGADYVDFKRRVDGCLLDRFSMGFYVAKFAQVITQSGRHVPDLERRAKKAITHGKTEELVEYLRKNGVDDKTIDRALAVIQAAAAIAGLFV